MNQKKAAHTLRVLLILGIFLIVGGLLLRRYKPELYLAGKAYTEEERALVLRGLMDELKLEDNEPAKALPSSRGILSWPQTSMVPEFHKTDLKIFSGRSRNKTALEGITIFLDAGESEEVITPTTASTTVADDGIRPAATDPYTGMLLPRYNQETMETRVEAAPTIPREQILENLALLVKDKLEAVGATVILTRERSSNGSDISQAAVVAEEICSRFLLELKQQKFKSSPISELVPDLALAKDSPSDPKVGALFTSNGVSPNFRLMLDVERQYQEVLFISLRFYQSSEKESGCRVIYFGESAAQGIGAARLSDERPSDQPAYVGYNGASRRRFAEQLYADIRGLLASLSYQGNKSAVSEEAQITGRLSNVTTVEIQIGNEKNESNLKILTQEEMLKSLAEAIALSCYRYYCD